MIAASPLESWLLIGGLGVVVSFVIVWAAGVAAKRADEAMDAAYVSPYVSPIVHVLETRIRDEELDLDLGPDLVAVVADLQDRLRRHHGDEDEARACPVCRP
jgi:hypothetical protein